ncbi:MAG: DUF6384 family protein [Azoarcus sp.]|jgi:hypothetical protein|nr:DUF6384 family protein [Azoarcus sp.]
MTSSVARPREDGTLQDQPRLDDILMAMDVVDTLRHEDELVQKELGQDERDEALKERLRKIYESQGLDVTERILDEGIRSLREDRFAYRPQGSRFARALAGLWIRRWLRLAIVGVFAICVGNAAWTAFEAHRFQVELTRTLPGQLSDEAARARSLAKVPEALGKIDMLLQGGEAALKREDADGAKKALADLKAASQRLGERFKLRIVSQPGRYSAVFRIPDDNPQAKNYYLIVEAIDDDDRVLAQDILDEETGRTKTVREWGQRVPFDTYEAVRMDKTDDGIIQNNIIGEKPPGHFAIQFGDGWIVQNGAITRW